MGDFSKFPESHHRASGRHAVRLQDGTQVVLEISRSSRPLRGNELVKASMAMQMGRPVSHRVDETSIALFVGRAGRMEIEVTNSGHYRYGRHLQRSLRTLVEQLAEQIAPQRPASEVPDEDDASPGFSR